MERTADNEEGDVTSWTLWILLALTTGGAPTEAASMVGAFGYQDLSAPDRVVVVRTWLGLREGVGPALLDCPAVDLVGLLMTELVDSGVAGVDPEPRLGMGLELCESLAPRLAPPELVPDPGGQPWSDPKTVSRALRDAAPTARTAVRRWCHDLAQAADALAPCRSLRLRLLSRPLEAWTVAARDAALEDVRARCGNTETSRLALVLHALVGEDEDFRRVSLLIPDSEEAREPLLEAAALYHAHKVSMRDAAREWSRTRDIPSLELLLKDAVGRRDRDGVRALVVDAKGLGDQGRRLGSVALARVGLAEEALASLGDHDQVLRANLAVFVALQTAMGTRAPDHAALDGVMPALAARDPEGSRRIGFVFDAVARLGVAYGDGDALAREAARVEAAGKALLRSSSDPGLDLAVAASQLYALEAWEGLDRLLDLALRIKPPSEQVDISLVAARVLLMVGVHQSDPDRVQQAHALLRRALERETRGSMRYARARLLATSAELYLAVRIGEADKIIDAQALSLQGLLEEQGADLSVADRIALLGNLFSLSTDAPSRRNGALASLWELAPGSPLTLLLTALDRWYDGKYLEAALLLRVLARSGCGGVLTSTASTWRAALRRRSGASLGEGRSHGGGRRGLRIIMDGDLRTRIFLDWEGRLRVEVRPRDQLLFLPSPPSLSTTP